MIKQVTCSACTVWSSCILSALEQEDWANLEPTVRRLHFRPKEVIFHQGVPVAGLYILCWGHAKLVFNAWNGKRLLICFYGAGDLLECPLSEEHVVSAVAVDEVVISFIPNKLTLELLKRQPELALEVGRRLAKERHMLLDRLIYLAYGSVRDRLVKALLELGIRWGGQRRVANRASFHPRKPC